MELLFFKAVTGDLGSNVPISKVSPTYEGLKQHGITGFLLIGTIDILRLLVIPGVNHFEQLSLLTIMYKYHIQLLGAVRSCLPPIEKHQPDPTPRSSSTSREPHLSGGFFELQSGLTFFHTSRSHGIKGRYDGFWSHPWNGILILGKNSFILFLEWHFDTGLFFPYSSWNGILMRILDFFCGGFVIFMLAGEIWGGR